MNNNQIEKKERERASFFSQQNPLKRFKKLDFPILTFNSQHIYIETTTTVYLFI